MTRTSRMLVVMVAIAVVGVVALALVADRYRQVTELRSVDDVIAASKPKPVPVPPPVEPVERPAAGAGDPGADASLSGAGDAEVQDVPAQTLAEVDRFIEVRAAVKPVVDADPRAFRILVEALEMEPNEKGEYRDRFSPQRVTLGRFVGMRKAKIDESGLGTGRYAEIREALRAWRDGGAVGADLGAAFAARAAELEAAEIGSDAETVDFAFPLENPFEGQ